MLSVLICIFVDRCSSWNATRLSTITFQVPAKRILLVGCWPSLFPATLRAHVTLPPHRSRYPSVVAVSLFSGMLPPLVGLPHHTGKWGNKLPTTRRDFFGDLGPDRVCVSLGHTQTAAGGACWKFTWAWIDVGNPWSLVCLHRPVLV